MTAGRTLRSRGGRRIVLAALLSALAASCSSTSEPSFDLANPSFTASGTAAMVADDAAAAPETTVTAEAGAERVPQDLALLSGVKPGEEPQAAGAKPVPEATRTAASAATGPVQAAKASAGEGEGAAAPDAGQFQIAAQTPAPPIEARKKSFLSAFFGAPAAKAAPAPIAAAAAPAAPAPEAPKPVAETKPLITLASAEPAKKPLVDIDRGDSGGDALPGVRSTSLFEIRHKSGIDDDSDVDLYEGGGAPLQLASAAGLARLAPNGLLKQRESVDVACLKPALVRVLKTVERHFGKKMIITSGYRSPAYNRKVRGATRSQHMFCAAADVQVPGVSKWELARYVRAMPGRGGVGTYCHTESVHIDIGPERDWNWKCRRRG